MAKQKEIVKILSFLPLAVWFSLESIQFLIYRWNGPLRFEYAKIDGLHVLSFAIFALLIAQLTFQKRQPINRDKLIALLIVLLSFISISISTFFSPYSDIAFTGTIFRKLGFLTVLELHLIFVYFLLFVESKKIFIKIATAIFLFLSSVHSIIAIMQSWQYGTSREIYFPVGDFVGGYYAQPNFLGSQFAMGICISSYLLISTKFKSKKEFLGLIIISLVFLLNVLALYLSDSRGAQAVTMLILFLIITNFGLKNIIKISQNTRIVLISILVVIFASIFFMFTYKNDLSRQLYWNTITTYITEKPIFGYGPDTLLAINADKSGMDGRIVDRSHNIYFDYLLWFGFAFCILWVSLFLFVFIRAYKQGSKINDLVPLLIIILVYLLTGIVHTKSIHQYAQASAMVGMLSAIVLTKKKDQSLTIKSLN